ncbi:MAG: hypothetical protein MJ182_07975 [Treponema sp.]|nr:hypothetical protein [Treponema sp.]
MKKIITAVAAVAMATTMFAADVAAQVRMAGNLFNLDADSKVRMLDVTNDNVANHKPALSLSVNGDKAGASVKYLNTYNNKDGATNAFALGAHSLWFSPVDMLKITLGDTDDAINQEHIGWCNTDLKVEGYGFRADVNVDAFSASLFMLAGKANNDNGNGVYNNYILDDGKLAEVDVKLAYGADWGTIGALVQLKENNDKVSFGAGYKGAAGSVSYFANAMAYMNKGNMSNIHFEADVATSIESVGIEVFLPVSYQLGDTGTQWYNAGWHKGCNYYAEKGALQIGTLAKVSMPVAGLNASVEFSSNNWLDKALAVNIKPGIAGSCGSMAWDCFLDMNINDGKFTLNVPFSTTINF